MGKKEVPAIDGDWREFSVRLVGTATFIPGAYLFNRGLMRARTWDGRIIKPYYPPGMKTPYHKGCCH